jgi:hypothetical protein
VQGTSKSTVIKTEHTCLLDRPSKKRKQPIIEEIGEVHDVTEQMKKQVEDLALEKVGLPSKEIAAFVLKQFDRDYSGYSISYLPFLSFFLNFLLSYSSFFFQAFLAID